MRLIAKFLLWIIGPLVPVMIAACYGMGYTWDLKSGQVVDSETEEGIEGIQIRCLRNGMEGDLVYSADDGTFTVHYYDPCEVLEIEDTDGEDNGGQYLTRTIPFDENSADLVIEMHK